MLFIVLIVLLIVFIMFIVFTDCSALRGHEVGGTDQLRGTATSVPASWRRSISTLSSQRLFASRSAAGAAQRPEAGAEA